MTILGMLAVSIILFLIGAQTQMIFLVGLGIMVFGVLFFYLRAKGMAMAPKAVLGCGIYAFVWGGLVGCYTFCRADVSNGRELLCMGIYRGLWRNVSGVGSTGRNSPSVTV